MSVMIGLEVHVQLNTESKLFCSDSVDARGRKPNENTCPICLGFPGSKPKLNKRAIDYAIMSGLALNCRIPEEAFMSRKIYFYPDLAKNFQISQYEAPMAVEGYLNISELKVRIRRIHIEEDPAKLVHVGGDITSAEYVLIDYNRSGIPLMEVVTEPDFTTPKQARQFLEKLSSILEHIGVYDSSRELSLRVDANISISGGERIEVKNITGFENVEKALNFEIIRQSGMERMQVTIEREVRHFDAETGSTKGLRKKEFEEDYGYMFDPDLPLIKIERAWVERIRSSMPELPDQRARRFASQYGLNDYTASVLIYTDKHLADFFEECCKLYKDPGTVATWTTNSLLKSLNWRSERIMDSKVTPKTFVELLELIDSKEITERYAKELIKEYVDTGIPPRELVNKSKVKLSKADLEQAVRQALEKNRQAAEETKAGKSESMQFLIGQVLALTHKQADPKEIRELILEMLKRE
jgi:aspartyl-tRNA(Asn)/glutamyl-tRNA(Gln) amidotransferase subunit B